MAGRPSRPRCAPVARLFSLALILFTLAWIVAAAGCGRTADPPAVARAPEARSADSDLPAPAQQPLFDPTPVPDSKKVGRPPAGGSGYLGAHGGMFGLTGGGGHGNFNSQNVGQLFQGGAGALGAFGGGFGGGQFGFQGGRQAAFPGPNVPPGFDPDMAAERYQHFHDNPFQAVKHEPRSTISTAVDTASYANVRARIKEGALPTKDAVRIADFVNYFPYDYAAPRNADPVAFKLELAPCQWQPTHHLLRVGLKARTIDKDQMPARNLVFLIDTSGSMNSDNRLPLVQESLCLLLERLTARDRVSIVTYAGAAGLRLPATPGNRREQIREVIDGLSAEGSTNGEGGLRVAYEQAEKTFLKDGINRVILATDGDFNVGVSDSAELVRLIEEKRKTGVYLTVLGYGMGNLQDETLEQLAHHGNGHYAYIDSLDEAKKVFVEQGGALVTVAKDVKLQVEFNPAKVAGYRLIGYENRVLRDEDFRDDAKDAGDLGSGHTSTALYEIVPAGEKVVFADVEPLKYQTEGDLTAAARSGEWLTVRMRYKHPETEKASEVSAVLPADGLAKESSADLRFASAVAAFGMILRDSEYRGDADYDKVLAWAQPVVGADPGRHRAEFLRLVAHAQALAAKIEPK